MAIPPEVMEIALENPALRQRAERIVEHLFDQMEYRVAFATRSEIDDLVKAAWVPTIRASQTIKDSAAKSDRAKRYDEMRLLMQQITGRADANDDAGA